MSVRVRVMVRVRFRVRFRVRVRVRVATVKQPAWWRPPAVRLRVQTRDIVCWVPPPQRPVLRCAPRDT